MDDGRTGGELQLGQSDLCVRQAFMPRVGISVPHGVWHVSQPQSVSSQMSYAVSSMSGSVLMVSMTLAELLG